MHRINPALQRLGRELKIGDSAGALRRWHSSCNSRSRSTRLSWIEAAGFPVAR
jgi:hypothetical protein